MNIDNEEYVDSIINALGELAIEYRGYGNPELSKQRYCELLKLLLSWGWNGWLEPDDELPEEDMPIEYIRHFQKFL